jgi:hypothetical protein
MNEVTQPRLRPGIIPMSIVVPCSCGQKLAATPQMYGRTISCPKCGRMLVVGSSQGAGGASADNSKLLLIVGIGAGTVLGIGVIFLLGYLALGSRRPAAPVATAPAAASTPAAPGTPQASTVAPNAAAPPAASPAPTSVAPTKPPASTPTTPTAPAKPAAPARNLVDVEPDFRTTPQDIGTEYKADPAAADAKYKGKVIEIDAEVSQCFPFQGELTAITSGNLESMFYCHFAEPDLWKKVAGRSKVKIKGVFRANDNKFKLEDCVFTEVGPSPRLVLTSDEMSAEARADRPRFRERVYGADILVKGEVASIVHNSGESVRVVLKTSEKPGIVVDTQARQDNVEAALKRDFPIGTKVLLVGRVLDETAQPLTDVRLIGQVIKDE